MWKSFFIGIGLGLAFIILAFLTDHSMLFSYITGGLALIALLISGIATNRWSKEKSNAGSTDVIKVSTEPVRNSKSMYRLALFSAPLLITTLFLYFT
ncbi:hypothetical protein ACQCT6_11475 [Cytobacillus gottheilii]|uniref:DUF5316 domain-containing protein n=1 Tax=Cytobacillus gottheilii TaxID=859144 RepID=A0ABX8F8Y2_9BACI|nr:hypothetical protein [Cytobacillus gottheilii]QVY60565.1 hypothetical protein J1899_16350 [Cytobacillus gottheilii]